MVPPVRIWSMATAVTALRAIVGVIVRQVSAQFEIDVYTTKLFEIYINTSE
jgi:hypothetical protein